MEQQMKIAGQRAAVMGLLTAILEDGEERSMKEIKDRILHTLDTLLDFEMVVGDFVDKLTFEAAQQHCQEQMALEAVQELLKN